MSMKTLLRVRFSDPPKASELLRMQDNVAAALDPIAAVPVLGSSQVQGVEFVSTSAPAFTINVEHGLGRPWTNWMVTDRDANESVWRSAADNPAKYLTLTASGAMTISVLVW